MSYDDSLHLAFLGLSDKPLWGGHLERGEPITSAGMRRWLEFGWIEQVGKEGYRMTPKGIAALDAYLACC